MKRILPLLLALLLLSSCASILETERVVITPHAEFDLPEPDPETPEVSNQTELRTAIVTFIRNGQTRGTINVFEFDGDLDSAVIVVQDEILTSDALAAYALSDLSITLTPIVSYFEVHADFVYRRTREQIAAVTNASTLRYLRSELTEMMSNYRSDAAFLTSLSEVTEESILAYLTEIYYENPLQIVMFPITTVTIYPETLASNGQKLVELTFNYSQPTAVLQRFGEWLRSATGDVAAAASGETDAEILLSLCNGLCDLAVYDEAAAELSVYPTQSILATAYGAMLGGSAIGEGYAMAFKALCDELSLPCQIVRGTRDGLPHAWNIVQYEGAFYHIDVSVCDTDGFETGFFRSDADMLGETRIDDGDDTNENLPDDIERPGIYEWARDAYPICEGTETFATIVAQAG